MSLSRIIPKQNIRVAISSPPFGGLPGLPPPGSPALKPKKNTNQCGYLRDIGVSPSDPYGGVEVCLNCPLFPGECVHVKRGNMRKYRHGNWRQTFVDCLGMCQYPVNGSICGAIDNLEFHEPFGEIHGAVVKFQQRVLLCCDHHAELEGVHAQELFSTNRKPTMLNQDVTTEIFLAGSYQRWLKQYHLIEPKAN